MSPCTGNDPAEYPELFIECNSDVPVSKNDLSRLTSDVESGESIRFSLLELVYVDPEEILRINSTYLNHDYVTDIITFRLDEETDRQSLEATLFCCAERIHEQSAEFGTPVEQEFLRVYVHGLLHLAGYDDQTPSEKQIMREAENRYLNASIR